MHFQIEVAPPSGSIVPATALQPDVSTELLKQVVELQKQQIMILRAMYAQHDGNTRWKKLLERWEGEFPLVAGACRESVPMIERAYLKLIQELTDKLHDDDGNPVLDDDFSLAEFLDRYAIRISQLGTMLNLIGPLADAAKKEEKND
ncbi:hypothetical protein KIH39_25910 [Telmatocola sphagniphila]|jgi:hypothetical protein|uniref:Uncharacterized protein n=1 Tax=Telmatocola sphagniphila TaxID=1123043 RepID=A0A8E6B6K5_9BACT|nr:hypothetical protein [Telmatocola sphagniphila]QVL32229.1 hypothetical protein KIH39_25910 [Telmatocola sphagniphila]